MLLTMMKSKLHKAVVTETELEYEGSITIDEDLMEKANMLPYERVQVVNLNNGSRLETYIITGKRGSGVICLNGPAARKACVGDTVIIISYAQLTPEETKDHEPTVVLLNNDNQVTKIHH